MTGVRADARKRVEMDPEIDLKLNLSDVTRIHDAMCVLDDRSSREEQILAYLGLVIATEQRRLTLSGRGSVGTPSSHDPAQGV